MNTNRHWVEHRWLISFIAFAVLLLVVMLVPFKLDGDSKKAPPQRDLPAPLKQSEKPPPLTLDPTPPQQTEAPPTNYDYLYAKAAELEFNPSRILKFVQEKIAPQDYSGSLRGPLGTLWSSAGNDIDRIDLLAELLKQSGERVRFARENEIFCVQIHHDGKWTDFPLDQDQQLQPPTWTGDEIPPELRCRLRIGVEVRAGQKHDLSAIEIDTANLAGNP